MDEVEALKILEADITSITEDPAARKVLLKNVPALAKRFAEIANRIPSMRYGFEYNMLEALGGRGQGWTVHIPGRWKLVARWC